MRHLAKVLSIGMAVLAGPGAIADAQDRPAADPPALYLANCSICHGVIAATSGSPRGPALAWALALSVTPSGDAAGPARREPSGAIGAGGPDSRRLAIAPPYGPTLRGVVGRRAGTVPGYLYSRAFREILRDVVWSRETLDRWITDSQAWASGSTMTYRQPDADVRRKIIDYLEAGGRPR